MKSHITLLYLTIYLVNIDAQTATIRPPDPTTAQPITWHPACNGSVEQPTCFGRGNEGHTTGVACSGANGNMWYYSQRYGFCMGLSYKGCDGNRNRFCSRTECKQRCEH